MVTTYCTILSATYFFVNIATYFYIQYLLVQKVL